MKNIKSVENAVRNISICLSKDKITREDLCFMKDEILLIENNMQDLIHLYDLLDARKKSDYFHADIDELVLKRNEDENTIPDKYQSITSDNADYYEQVDKA
tara:strand:- start:1229 stop:1531 length:303 start_codon:yes stop_codon:yes gene_type:complete